MTQTFKNHFTVLSLFDGMSCGHLALDRAEIPITKYYASEIDKYAIKITQDNFPETIQLGDITKWREWGFKYQRCLTWDKANGVCFFGFHHRTELCLFGYRGKIEMYPRRKAVPTVFSGRSARHSAKPDEFYKLVEPLGERRIDVFARRGREGWTVWGNEV